MMQPTDLFRMPGKEIQTRWFTGENPEGLKGVAGQKRSGRKGAPCVVVKPGESYTLAEIQGSGTIRRIWVTGSVVKEQPEGLRGFKIEFFWDGAPTAAVQAPLGDFFCHSLGRMIAFENALFSSPEGKSFNCIAPMPFRTGARIVLTNETAKDHVIFYEVDCTVGDAHDADMLYFHAHWRRENPTVLRQDLTILPQVRGRGRYLGCNLGVRLNQLYNQFWWGEGEVKVYLDGDTQFPTLCGTGTEDYIGTGWCTDRFIQQYQGNHFVAENKRGYGFYRLHVPDPVYFHEDARVTLQVMSGAYFKEMLAVIDTIPTLRIMKAGDGTEYYSREELVQLMEKDPEGADVSERIDDYCVTAYWYLDKPENALPPLPAPAERIKDAFKPEQ